MAEETKQQNPLAKFDQALQTAKSVKDLFSIPDVKERFIKNFEAATGRKDGANRLEQERFAYMEIINEKQELKGAPIWAHFSALLKSATTGLSFRDNKLYVQPKKDRDGNIVGLKVDPSPAGRREMMEMMPTIKKVPQAQVVMKGDIFVYDKLNEKIIKHETTDKSSSDDKMENTVASYQRVYWKNGDISDVVVYQSDLIKARNKSKIKNPEQEGVWLFNGEACKKTATNRAFRLYHKYPDGVVVYDDDTSTEEESTIDSSYTEPDQTAIESFRPDVNENTGEVYEPTVEDKPKLKKTGKEPEKFV